ncbi:MAG: hypothetical protein HOP29_00365 [Phycisphaerales bacterium]|nr:hypothetical protein [Phycisphaerales bacterium]
MQSNSPARFATILPILSVLLGAPPSLSRAGVCPPAAATKVAVSENKYDRFGTVATSGDTVLVGADLADSLGFHQAGVVYVYQVLGGSVTLTGRLEGYEIQSLMGFGNSVDIDGDTAVVGASREDEGAVDGAGAAYVFVRSGGIWTMQSRLTASDLPPEGHFGYEVAIDGDVIAVAATHSDSAAFDAGAVYIFERSGSVWTEQIRIIPADAASQDYFGQSLSVSNGTVVASKNADDAACPGDPLCDSGAAYVYVKTAGVWGLQQKIVAPDAAGGDFFGWSVAVDGDTLVAGARGDDDDGQDSGAAYVFNRSGGMWTLQSKLVASDASPLDGFGSGVELNEDTVVVGSPFDDDNGSGSGSAYVFHRNGTTWSESQKLLAADGDDGDGFGWLIGLDADTLVISALGDDEAGLYAGAAYVFTLDAGAWEERQKLSAIEEVEFQYLGDSVSCTQIWILAGEPGDDTFGADSGKAFVFDRFDATWRVEATLTAPDAEAGDGFGKSVAAESDRNVVGAPGEDDLGADAGAVYAYLGNASGWDFHAKFTAADGEAGDAFGSSLALHFDTAVVGAPGDDDGGVGAGSAYVFVVSGGGWSQEVKLTAADADPDDAFGSAIAISGDRAVVGAPGDDDGGADAGAAYVFERSGAVWTPVGKLTATDASTGQDFGRSVSVSGGLIIVGAPGDDEFGDGAGAGYVYADTGGGWSQQVKLAAPDAAGGDAFGSSVSASADYSFVAVGASGDDDLGADSGSAYLFATNFGQWALYDKLLGADAAPGDRFGNSLSIAPVPAGTEARLPSGEILPIPIVVIGARQNVGEGFTEAGALYLHTFALNCPPCGNGIVEAPEECDPGAWQPGGCCTVLCTAEPAGLACDDGDVCTTDDVCDASGVCDGDVVFGCGACGNGLVEGAEDCDPGVLIDGDCCGSDCMFDPPGTPCDDADICTMNESCSATGVCAGGGVFDCPDGNVCTRDACVDGACINVPGIFGDVDGNGNVDVFDILCMLDGFAGVFTNCTRATVDIAPCPGGDDLIDIFDILAVLDAFTGVDPCNCP